jgi:hypothetical protein
MQADSYRTRRILRYDGVHLTSIGYALIARDLIAFINRTATAFPTST